MNQHNYNKKSYTETDYKTWKKERELSQKIKELIQAPPALIDAMPEGVVKEEVKELREFAEKQGVEA